MFPKDSSILIVEDMKTTRLYVKQSLRTLGFKTFAEAADGAEAWDKINLMAGGGTPFQLVISDWNMPKMTGFELLKKVRGMPKIAGTPFLLLTAEAEKHQVVQAIQAKVSDYLIKPFSDEQLEEKIKNIWNSIQKKAA